MIDGAVKKIEIEEKDNFNIILTGGMAEVVGKQCLTDNIIIDENLLLKGLIILYNNTLNS